MLVQTVVQQHLLYWDRDGDGEVTPVDIWVGFRDLGFTVPVCLLACTVIPLAFSYSTRIPHSLLPDPLLRIYVDSAYKAKVTILHTENMYLGANTSCISMARIAVSLITKGDSSHKSLKIYSRWWTGKATAP